jgi:hypothetical protein
MHRRSEDHKESTHTGMSRGYAAALCGKAVPYRRGLITLNSRLRLEHRRRSRKSIR